MINEIFKCTTYGHIQNVFKIQTVFSKSWSMQILIFCFLVSPLCTILQTKSIDALSLLKKRNKTISQSNYISQLIRNAPAPHWSRIKKTKKPSVRIKCKSTELEDLGTSYTIFNEINSNMIISEQNCNVLYKFKQLLLKYFLYIILQPQWETRNNSYSYDIRPGATIYDCLYSICRFYSIHEKTARPYQALHTRVLFSHPKISNASGFFNSRPMNVFEFPRDKSLIPFRVRMKCTLHQQKMRNKYMFDFINNTIMYSYYGPSPIANSMGVYYFLFEPNLSDRKSSNTPQHLALSKALGFWPLVESDLGQTESQRIGRVINSIKGKTRVINIFLVTKYHAPIMRLIETNLCIRPIHKVPETISHSKFNTNSIEINYAQTHWAFNTIHKQKYIKSQMCLYLKIFLNNLETQMVDVVLKNVYKENALLNVESKLSNSFWSSTFGRVYHTPNPLAFGLTKVRLDQRPKKRLYQSQNYTKIKTIPNEKLYQRQDSNEENTQEKGKFERNEDSIKKKTQTINSQLRKLYDFDSIHYISNGRKMTNHEYLLGASCFFKKNKCSNFSKYRPLVFDIFNKITFMSYPLGIYYKKSYSMLFHRTPYTKGELLNNTPIDDNTFFNILQEKTLMKKNASYNECYVVFKAMFQKQKRAPYSQPSLHNTSQSLKLSCFFNYLLIQYDSQILLISSKTSMNQCSEFLKPWLSDVSLKQSINISPMQLISAPKQTSFSQSDNQQQTSNKCQHLAFGLWPLVESDLGQTKNQRIRRVIDSAKGKTRLKSEGQRPKANRQIHFIRKQKYKYYALYDEHKGLNLGGFSIYKAMRVKQYILFEKNEMNHIKTKNNETISFFNLNPYASQQQGFGHIRRTIKKNKVSIVLVPSKYNINNYLQQIKQIITNSKAHAQDSLINRLAQKINLWCYSYRIISNKKIFYYCDHMILKWLWRWSCRRHPNKNKNWIKNKYFHYINKKNNNDTNQGRWNFCVYKNSTRSFYCLPKHSRIKLVRHSKIPEHYSIYDENWKYWLRRLS
uniref:Putative intron maturase n=1 Tax=Bracteacoccus giganteus TaxID=50039 RepID=A0A0S2LQT5_9CHLO|nr:putative intron maturase [Bracteacoccus giganteus]ALO63555.1 putative intron maturase [Bracteacoccus giganteus]